MRKHRLKTVGDLRGKRPEVSAYLQDIYDAFYLLDRDGWTGRVRLDSMREMLAEMEVANRADRLRILSIWRQMDAEQRETDKRLKESDAPADS